MKIVVIYKLVVVQLVKKLLGLYRNRNFIHVYTRTRRGKIAFHTLMQYLFR